MREQTLTTRPGAKLDRRKRHIHGSYYSLRILLLQVRVHLVFEDILDETMDAKSGSISFAMKQ